MSENCNKNCQHECTYESNCDNESPAPSQPEASPEPQARECATDVLTNCSRHFVTPSQFRPDNPQSIIEMAIANAERIITAHAAAQNAALRQEVERLRQERDESRKVQLRHDKGESWFYQGDGYDFPESLTCPVIMQADTFRRLLASEGQKLEWKNGIHPDACGDCGYDAKTCECRKGLQTP